MCSVSIIVTVLCTNRWSVPCVCNIVLLTCVVCVLHVAFLEKCLCCFEEWRIAWVRHFSWCVLVLSHSVWRSGWRQAVCSLSMPVYAPPFVYLKSLSTSCLMLNSFVLLFLSFFISLLLMLCQFRSLFVIHCLIMFSFFIYFILNARISILFALCHRYNWFILLFYWFILCFYHNIFHLL